MVWVRVMVLVLGGWRFWVLGLWGVVPAGFVVCGGLI